MPVLWKPNPGPQTAFLACPVREILYGGAKGGGKTDAIGPKALKHITMYGQWAYVLILREKFPHLRELMDRIRPLALAMGGTYTKLDKTWAFHNGARLQFGHTSDGCDPYWGQEYSLIVIDEVTRTIKDKTDYDMLLGSLRNSRGVPCSIVLTSNPGGVGHSWVKERFLGVPAMTVQVDPVTGFERVFIPAGLKDNPNLPPEYRKQLEQMGDKERRAYLDGDWSAFEGTVFKLERGTHIWTWAQFKAKTGHDAIPDHWVRFRVMDWGYAHPFAILWIASDEDGRGYVYREWYGVAHNTNGTIKPDVGVSMQPTVVGERIKAIEAAAKEKVAYGWTGPDLNSAGTGDTSAGITRLEYFQRAGVDFSTWNAGKDSRAAKKTAVDERLRPVDGVPGLIFLHGEPMTHPKDCGELTAGAKHCIRTIPGLEYDPNGGGEDIDTDGEDHAYDALSAWCLMRPWKAKKQLTEAEAFQAQFRQRTETPGSWMGR